jgi:hypothetical protein
MINTYAASENRTLMNVDHMERLLSQLNERELKLIFAIAFNLIPSQEYTKYNFAQDKVKYQILENLALRILERSSLIVSREKHTKHEDERWFVTRTAQVTYLLRGYIAATFQNIHNEWFGFTYNSELTQMYIEKEAAKAENLPLLDQYLASIQLKQEE